MSVPKIDPGAGVQVAPSGQDDELIARAAKRTDWAGTALESAALDLGDVHGNEGAALTNLAEVVQEEATRVSNLAEDIESHRPGDKQMRYLGRRGSPVGRPPSR
jgi:hypothetical protein